MCPSHFYRVRVESESQGPRVRVNEYFFESSHSHDLVEFESSHKNFRVTSSHWFASSSQCRVIRNFTFFWRHFFAMKWHPTCRKMDHDKLENVVQCCFNKFDCRLFISKFSQFSFYFCLSLSIISESLAQPCGKCCSLSAFVVNVRFTGCAWRTTPMCREQAEIKWARHGIFIVACCHSVKLCALPARRFQSHQMVLWPGCEDGDRCNLHKKNVQWVRFIAKTRECCCHFSVGVALTVWFS